MNTKIIISILSVLLILSIFGCTQQTADITGAVAYNTTKISKFWDKISSTEPTKFIIEDDNIAIKEVWINVEQDTEYSGMDVIQLPRKPVYAPNLNEPVFQYLEIVTSNILDSNTKISKIIFRVDRDWMYNSGIISNTIKLWYLRDSKWEYREATQTDFSNNAVIEYKADVDKFDQYYAITGEQKQTEQVTEVTEAEIEEPIDYTSLIIAGISLGLICAGLLGYLIGKETC